MKKVVLCLISGLLVFTNGMVQGSTDTKSQSEDDAYLLEIQNGIDRATEKHINELFKQSEKDRICESLLNEVVELYSEKYPKNTSLNEDLCKEVREKAKVLADVDLQLQEQTEDESANGQPNAYFTGRGDGFMWYRYRLNGKSEKEKDMRKIIIDRYEYGNPLVKLKRRSEHYMKGVSDGSNNKFNWLE